MALETRLILPFNMPVFAPLAGQAALIGRLFVAAVVRQSNDLQTWLKSESKPEYCLFTAVDVPLQAQGRVLPMTIVAEVNSQTLIHGVSGEDAYHRCVETVLKTLEPDCCFVHVYFAKDGIDGRDVESIRSEVLAILGENGRDFIDEEAEYKAWRQNVEMNFRLTVQKIGDGPVSVVLSSKALGYVRHREVFQVDLFRILASVFPDADPRITAVSLSAVDHFASKTNQKDLGLSDGNRSLGSRSLSPEMDMTVQPYFVVTSPTANISGILFFLWHKELGLIYRAE